jgi:hypothetical protein
MQLNNATIGLIAVILFGILAGIAAIIKMQGGFGKNNTRVFGIILVATFTTVLALSTGDNVSAAMGILGAIAGYLFGVTTTNPNSD